jgi:a disintegrin and metalloproteinase with thrombospondin motifs 18
MKVRGLSGKGMQIASSVEDPDRSCRVACQDKFIAHRFYLVNGEHGFFPFGINCSFRSGDERRFCVNGKCIKFGLDDTPASGYFFSQYSAGRMRRSVESGRAKRHYTYYQNDNFTEHVSKDYLNRLIKSIEFKIHNKSDKDVKIDAEHIDLHNPVDIFH